MEWAHVLFTVFAAFRLTNIFTTDAIWERVRLKFPRIPWHCGLCMSVWAGIACTLFLVALPWLNWPLALSWLYLTYKRGLRLDNTEIEARVAAMQAEYEMTISAMVRRAAMVAAETASLAKRLKEKEVELEASKKGSPAEETE